MQHNGFLDEREDGVDQQCDHSNGNRGTAHPEQDIGDRQHHHGNQSAGDGIPLDLSGGVDSGIEAGVEYVDNSGGDGELEEGYGIVGHLSEP